MNQPRSATARAHPNIALIKYWGKRDRLLNLPAAGSISITLDTFETVTTVRFGAQHDSFHLNGAANPDQANRVFAWLDRFRRPADPALRAAIESENNFPTAAGLASSASGFAALALATAEALGSASSPRELSVAARLGSGSAARSIFGGFARMHAGRAADGSDACAEGLLSGQDWPLRVVIAITGGGAKEESSTVGMERSRLTSPFYADWVRTTKMDLVAAEQAIQARDFERLAELSEASCLQMHAVMLATRPGLVYWNGATVDCIHLLRGLRNSGTAVFFTIDAGPQVKAVCPPAVAARVESELAGVPGVSKVVTVSLGPGAYSLPRRDGGEA